MENLIKSLNQYAASLPKAEVYYRDSWECEYYDLLGKNFGRIGTDKEGKMQLTVKGKPEENEILRETYTSVVPGYYANKVHWNSVYLDTQDFTEEALQKMIKNSYELVKSSFTKKIQKEIDELL
ncbi:putative DNA-binding protein (MmcQ/YjbR family) [Enterococcus sp. PF1-24]|uniref:MmcQ/YjbR family DNA-binding protein n=1 Tax=unclassified Enterococcus TaxID=2608891 RepID=UPI002473AB2A|nr:MULTISPECIES: MmcQ/YjbR family DNA-binding protein [unclassified Enterococcus]MDH6364116.1 putative DNA-binding protein (MmcQ/YjbR family) [Enterococcus sp. PFB1-1]MDH6401217.1 putative DNA-binding protein (MmcQ/YjbR family) [Enterococcus sp. PF1-24]